MPVAILKMAINRAIFVFIFFACGFLEDDSASAPNGGDSSDAPAELFRVQLQAAFLSSLCEQAKASTPSERRERSGPTQLMAETQISVAAFCEIP